MNNTLQPINALYRPLNVDNRQPPAPEHKYEVDNKGDGNSIYDRRRKVDDSVIRGEYISSLNANQQNQRLINQQIDPQNRSAIEQYSQGAGSESNISRSGILLDSFA
ncbi:MAG: hypothetical protein ACI845_003081 [Gammaproteobacteria bacterium]